jgi:hypothetical protein
MTKDFFFLPNDIRLFYCVGCRRFSRITRCPANQNDECGVLGTKPCFLDVHQRHIYTH